MANSSPLLPALAATFSVVESSACRSVLQGALNTGGSETGVVTQPAVAVASPYQSTINPSKPREAISASCLCTCAVLLEGYPTLICEADPNQGRRWTNNSVDEF